MMAVAARWPSAVDYQTALQTPTYCFSDPSLRQGFVMTDPLGLPLASSGNVVVVFRLKLKERDVAVRCFTRQSTFPTLQRRYEALTAHRKQYHLPALVASRYRPDELLVSGQRFGIVQMEWVRGIHLHRYVETHLEDPKILHALADQWRILMAQLRTTRLAHGDLSDGNILVDRKARLRLIDYDAAYVPDLSEEPSHELGKPNYQHPERLDPANPHYGYYAENMDAFAALTIYLSLRALADDPARWVRYHTGENLIFVQDDFLHPGFSPIWRELRTSEDAEVSKLTALLEQYCWMPVDSLPDLEVALLGSDTRPMNSPAPVPEEEEPMLMAVGEVAVDRDPVPPGMALQNRWVRGRPMLRLSAVVLGVALLGLLGLSGLSGEGGKDEESVRQEEKAVIATATMPLPARGLAGFYTGYATSKEGTREALALTIETPDTLQSDQEALFPYTINSPSYQEGGVGRYHVQSGRVDLGNHYELYVATFAPGEVELASRARNNEGSLVKIKKRQ